MSTGLNRVQSSMDRWLWHWRERRCSQSSSCALSSLLMNNRKRRYQKRVGMMDVATVNFWNSIQKMLKVFWYPLSSLYLFLWSISPSPSYPSTHPFPLHFTYCLIYHNHLPLTYLIISVPFYPTCSSPSLHSSPHRSSNPMKWSSSTLWCGQILMCPRKPAQCWNLYAMFVPTCAVTMALC